MTPTNGLQFYSKLKDLSHKSKIVFITAIDAVDQINSMIPEIDKKYVLQKPVNREKFIQTITMALKNE
jgi:two-component SAPR family response regulator